jgi:hypothetical protein
MRRTQQAQQVEPTHPGHYLIQQNQIVVRLVDLFERFRCVFSDFNLISAARQAAMKQIAILRVVVDDQQFTRLRCHKPSPQRNTTVYRCGILFGQIRRIVRTLAGVRFTAMRVRPSPRKCRRQLPPAAEALRGLKNC